MSKKPLSTSFPRNDTYRPRGEWLHREEINRLAKAAAKIGRHGHRDETIIREGFRHGLRVTELIELRRDQVHFPTNKIHIRRLKGSKGTDHDMSPNETRALRRIFRECPDSPWVFTSQKGGPLTRSAVQKMMTRAAHHANLNIKVHPHMLRHSCGYDLANSGIELRKIQVWLGHVDVKMTIKYAELSAHALKGIMRD